MNKLKELREAKGLTRTGFAAKLGVSERYIFFLEAGDRTPSLKLAYAISNELGASVDDIFLPIKCTKRTFNNGDVTNNSDGYNGKSTVISN